MRNDGANRIGRLVVMPGSGDQASKLELLRAACKELEPVSGDHARRRAIRYGIVNSARQVKTSYELHSMKVSGRPVQRSDLRKALESVQVHARGLETLLSRRDVQEALAQASRSKEWIAQTTIYLDYGLPDYKKAIETIPKAAQEYREIQNALANVAGARRSAPRTLIALRKTAEGAILGLDLKGRRGQDSPWVRFKLPPKVLQAFLGGELFCEARHSKVFPSQNNDAFVMYLSLAWELATGVRDDQEWTSAIRDARQEMTPQDTKVAHYKGILAAGELAEWIDEKERILRAAQKVGLQHPK